VGECSVGSVGGEEAVELLAAGAVYCCDDEVAGVGEVLFNM
jgi:hypothetical protein